MSTKEDAPISAHFFFSLFYPTSSSNHRSFQVVTALRHVGSGGEKKHKLDTKVSVFCDLTKKNFSKMGKLSTHEGHFPSHFQVRVD